MYLFSCLSSCFSVGHLVHQPVSSCYCHRLSGSLSVCLYLSHELNRHISNFFQAPFNQRTLWIVEGSLIVSQSLRMITFVFMARTFTLICMVVSQPLSSTLFLAKSHSVCYLPTAKQQTGKVSHKLMKKVKYLANLVWVKFVFSPLTQIFDLHWSGSQNKINDNIALCLLVSEWKKV